MNRDLLAAFDASLRRLLAALPGVWRSLPDAAAWEDEPRWRLLRQNADDLSGRPLPVVALLGPSGAGKSTLFNLITGSTVPAGGHKRPMTYNSIVAAPADLPEATLTALFPERTLTPLTSPDDLRRRDLPRETLYYLHLPAANSAEGDFVLADVPDFNTTCQENWARAEVMLQRAEVIIFVTDKSHYADQQTLLYLARASALAGQLVFLLTMADRAAAEIIWEDLCTEKAQEFTLRPEEARGEPAHPFAEPRADGRTRAQFLSGADVYFSPMREQPRLDEIQPLRAGAAALVDFLRGQNIAQLMLAKRANDLQQGLKLADEALASHAQAIQENKAIAEQAAQQMERSDIVGRQLPVGEVLDAVLREAKGSLPWWRTTFARGMDVLALPLAWLGTGARWLWQKLTIFFADPQAAASVSRETAEREAVEKAARALADLWRAEWRQSFDLSGDRCAKLIEEFSSGPLPAPDATWQEFATAQASAWVRENPNKATLLLNAGGFITLLAGAAVTFDVVTTGGVVTLVLTKANLAIAGGTSAGVGALLAGTVNRLVQRLGMGKLLETFQAEWNTQRNRQLRSHLHARFARPLLLDPLAQRVARLDAAPTAECRAAVADLRQQLAASLSR